MKTELHNAVITILLILGLGAGAAAILTLIGERMARAARRCGIHIFPEGE